MILRILLSFYVLGLSFSVTGQQLRFRHLTSEDGLSTNFVKAIARDDKGFMWFGTQDGLNCYNGYDFEVFRHHPGDSASLVNSDISVIRQVRENLFIIGTRAGCSLFNPVTGVFSQPVNSKTLRTGKVYDILVKDAATALIACDEGLLTLSLSSYSLGSVQFGAATPTVKCLAEWGNEIFAGTLKSGVWKINSDLVAEKIMFVVADSISADQEQFSSICAMTSYGGELFMGTPSSGIFRCHDGFEIRQHISFGSLHPNTDVIRDLKATGNRIFAATAYGVVVYHLVNGKVSHYTRHENAYSLNANGCNVIYSDPQNNLWVGTDLGGVNISFFRAQKFPLSLFGYESYFDNIYALLETKPGTVLLGGVKTLHELDLATAAVTDHSSLLGAGTALCLAPDGNEGVWVGTWGNGLIRYNLRTRKSETVTGTPAGGTIASLFKDGNYIYAGSVGDGLFRVNIISGQVSRYTEADGLPNGSVNCIFRDSHGTVWIGTYDGGLVEMSDFVTGNGKLPVRKIHTGGTTKSVPSSVIYAVNEDNAGRIWVATSAGLARLQADGSFRTFSERQGLSSALIYSLVKDSAGHFWMSSHAGLYRFDPMLADDEIIFKAYGPKDGLVNSGYHVGAASFSQSGLLYFGGPGGFNVFRPSAVKDNMHLPPVYVTGYRRGGVEIKTDTMPAYKKRLVLASNENHFQFEMVALDFTDPPKNKFRYKLEGYDSDWSTPTQVRYVTYSQLPGGEYVFKVKASNNDGVWNETPYEIAITVETPFWETTSFYVLIIAIALMAIYGVIHVRTRAMRLENRLLEMKVSERTKELEERNREITSSIEYARRIQEAILPSRDHIFSALKKVFILYRPKDIVSGDFYWFGERSGVKVFAVVDCTGHGVPGAFMSMIGHNLMHQIVNEKGITDPGEILNRLHKGVQRALRQGHNEIQTNDGMDVSILAVNDGSREVLWAGANRPLILININGDFNRFDGDKFPVGGAQAHLDRQFTTRLLKPEVATMAYMFTDGYADQFGGDRGKKFMVKRFHQVLTTIHHLPVEQQQGELEKVFLEWKQNHEQVDDVLIVGVEV